MEARCARRCAACSYLAPTLTRGDLVPGTDIEYYWQIDNSAGQSLKTETFKYSFPDDRFDFKSMSAPVGKGKVTVFWYGSDDAYGRERLAVAARLEDHARGVRRHERGGDEHLAEPAA